MMIGDGMMLMQMATAKEAQNQPLRKSRTDCYQAEQDTEYNAALGFFPNCWIWSSSYTNRNGNWHQGPINHNSLETINNLRGLRDLESIRVSKTS